MVDTDNIKTTQSVTASRNESIKQIILQYQEEGIDEDVVINFKKNIDPILDSVFVSQKIFDAAYIEDIANKKDYDVIIIDTAGQKSDTNLNFDIRKISAANSPHITTAYVSNLVIVPMRVSSLEMLAAQNYYIPLNTFLSACIRKLS